MKINEKRKTCKKVLTVKEITEWLLENCVDKHGLKQKKMSQLIIKNTTVKDNVKVTLLKRKD